MDVVEDCKKFLKKIEELKPYLVEFNKDDIIKEKDYSVNFIVNSYNIRPVIIITHDEYTFFPNNKIWKV